MPGKVHCPRVLSNTGTDADSVRATAVPVQRAYRYAGVALLATLSDIPAAGMTRAVPLMLIVCPPQRCRVSVRFATLVTTTRQHMRP